MVNQLVLSSCAKQAVVKSLPPDQRIPTAHYLQDCFPVPTGPYKQQGVRQRQAYTEPSGSAQASPNKGYCREPLPRPCPGVPSGPGSATNVNTRYKHRCCTVPKSEPHEVEVTYAMTAYFILWSSPSPRPQSLRDLPEATRAPLRRLSTYVRIRS